MKIDGETNLDNAFAANLARSEHFLVVMGILVEICRQLLWFRHTG
jgi:hypothetical protein